MLKKLLSLLCTAALTLPVAFPVFAASEPEIYYFDRTDAESVILTAFDEAGKLSGLQVCGLIVEEGRSYIQMPAFEDAVKIRAYFPGDEAAQTIKDANASPSPSPAPDSSAPPSPSPSSPATPTAVPTEKPEKRLPAVYPREADADRAPALVKEVSSAVSDKGESVTRLSLLYQGQDYTLDAEQGFLLNSVPDAVSSFSEMTVDNLEPGDIIDMSFYLSGELRTINLLLRPAEENIMTSETDYGNSFEKLFSANGIVGANASYRLLKYGSASSSAQYGYAFGVLTDRSPQDMALMNKEGKESESLILALDPETVVYVCDMANRKEIYPASISALLKTNIPESDMDEDGNVINWPEDQTYNYVFVRTVEDTAADVIIYTNYNDR